MRGSLDAQLRSQVFLLSGDSDGAILFVLQLRAATHPIACIADSATATPSTPKHSALMKPDGVRILPEVLRL